MLRPGVEAPHLNSRHHIAECKAAQKVGGINLHAAADVRAPNALSGGAQEPGAEVVPVVPPDHLVGAVPGGRVARKDQHELIQAFNSIDPNPDPLVRDVGHGTAARLSTKPRLYGGLQAQRTPRTLASFPDIQRTHDARSTFRPRLFPAATAVPVKSTAHLLKDI